jgi:hypothetical protein
VRARALVGLLPLALYLLGLFLFRMLPEVSIALPVAVAFLRWGLMDSVLALALAHLTLVLPVAAWVLTTTFLGIPREVEEAAALDGCSAWQTLWRVTLRLAVPGLAVAGLLAWLFSWEEFVRELVPHRGRGDAHDGAGPRAHRFPPAPPARDFHGRCCPVSHFGGRPVDSLSRTLTACPRSTGGSHPEVGDLALDFKQMACLGISGWLASRLPKGGKAVCPSTELPGQRVRLGFPAV